MSSSVQFSRSVVSDSLRPHGQQHARPPCPSSTPRVYPNSCPLSQWCHPTISSSVIPFPSRLQSSPASGSFQMSQLYASGGQSIGVLASTSVLPMNIQDWFPLGWYWLTLLVVQVTLKSLLQHHSSKWSILHHSAFFMAQLSHPYMPRAWKTRERLKNCHRWEETKETWQLNANRGLELDLKKGH